MTHSPMATVHFVGPKLGDRVEVYDEMPPQQFWVGVSSGNQTDWELYVLTRTAANVAIAEPTGTTVVQRH